VNGSQFSARADSNRYLKYVGAVSHGGYVYLFGGNGGSTSTANTNYAQVYRYDPAADSYSSMTSMPVAAGAPLCIPDGDSVLVVVGDTVYRYDIGADSWSTEGTLDSSVSGRGAAVAGW
jgi:N-acetylneuraminic acid mutarotase